MVEEAVLCVAALVAEALPSRSKIWMRVEMSIYAHPIVDKILYATR
jgi:hypothetical protein